MNTRTTHFVVRFASAFMLRGLDARQPAGEYRIEQDEELIEGISWLAYRRVATFIHLPAIAAGSMTGQVVRIDPADLEESLQEDLRSTSADSVP